MGYNGGNLLIDSLVAMGAKKAFGVPGESYLAALNGLYDTQGTLDYILCRQEGGAAYMAAAYGKLTGTPGICFVTRGPGATNASIGVHTAMQDSVPMLLFVGQVATSMKGREAFQELDYKSVFGSMAKWAVEIDQVERIPEILARAWRTALNGRPGPVVVALPEDMLATSTGLAPLAYFPEVRESAPTAEVMQTLHGLLAKASRPVIYYAGCNWQAAAIQQLQQFAEAENIPVVAGFRYQDQFDNHSAVFCGEAGVGMASQVSTLLREADVVLAINATFGEMETQGYSLFSVPLPKQKIIHVHASDAELGKVYIPTLAVHTGINEFALALRDLPPVDGGWDAWCANARAAYEASFTLNDLPSPVDMGKVCAHLRKCLPEDVIITNGAGNFTVWPSKFLQYGAHARLLAPQSGAMGYGLPAAIAAKVACPERMVLCFAGDGDFQMNVSELGTALQAGAQPIVLVLENGIYGTIRAHQERQYPERVLGTSMEKNPDFVALAKAYGMHAEKVVSTTDFAAAFSRACASESGAVLVLSISPEALTPHKTLSQIRQQAINIEGR